MLDSVTKLFISLNNNGIRYCHWKSNFALDKSLNGETDIDLLVDRGDVDKFEVIIKSMNFKLSIQPKWKSSPFVYHYYKLDDNTGVIVHLHVYYKIITGGSILKNYGLQLEEMLIKNYRYLGIVKVPSKAAELIIFIIRKMLEHTSLIELYLFYKDYDNIKNELNWFYDSKTIEEAEKLFNEWLPDIDQKFFYECFEKLRSKSPLVYRIRLGIYLRKYLKNYRLNTLIKASLLRSLIFLHELLSHRYSPNQKDRKLSNGGAIIAFVGPEASGKTTLVREIKSWLDEYFSVVSIHAGKPPSTVFHPVVYLKK